MNYSLFISAPRGLEYLLEDELKQLGLTITKVSPQGVYGEGNLAVLYTLCLWSRIANRVQLVLFSGQAYNDQTLHQLVMQFPWQTVFTHDKTMAVEFHGQSKTIRNTMYGAQLVKDAIVDHFRLQTNNRPSIDKENPNIKIQAYLKNETLTVSLDLTGFSLHQRGYRLETGLAPIKENVAAAMLYRAKWPQLAAQGYGLYDPVCGAGTLVIEAALMAGNIAPGLFRQDQAFCHWVGHEATLWEKIREQSLSLVKPISVSITGSDISEAIIDKAKANAKAAGVLKFVEFLEKPLEACVKNTEKGLLIANPPYGERLDDAMSLIPVYQELGRVVHQQFKDWHIAILTSNPMLAKATGLRFPKQYAINNGAIECKLYCGELDEKHILKGDGDNGLSPGALMILNRLKKNDAHLKKWAKRHQVEAYRLYDADLPEYAFALDYYKDYVVLQEYAAPKTIAPHLVEKRRLEMLQAIPQALDIHPSHIIIKERKPQKGSDQYQKMANKQKRLIIQEGAIQCYVNLYDYLDTGLFLDHRLLRTKFEQMTPDSRFLNLFCYTGVASLHAAKAGAKTTNVDMSNTYLKWAEDNFTLNDFDVRHHQFVQFDCMKWLQSAQDKFDVIFLDPPSFSNSKRMEGFLDIQRDHPVLIQQAMQLLSPGGTLYFSTNLTKFELSPIVTAHFKVKDISRETIDEDFKRNTKIHQCFEICR